MTPILLDDHLTAGAWASCGITGARLIKYPPSNEHFLHKHLAMIWRNLEVFYNLFNKS